jgi:predicted flap endonuclease-1-like 5' DNA nuclease
MARTITKQQFDKEIQKIPQTTDRARDLALQRMERIRKFAGGAAVREMARRRARDGADAVETTQAATRMISQSRSITRLREDLKGATKEDPAQPDTIAVGRIMQSGRPFGGATVVFSTESGQAVGEAVTDRSGAFTFQRSREEFKKLVEGARSLIVVIRDANRRDVHKTMAAIPPSFPMTLNIDVAAERPVTPTDTGVTPVRTTTMPAAPHGTVALDEIKGLGPARTAKLTAAGIYDSEAVAAHDPAALAKILGVNRKQAAQIVAEAKKKPPSD